MHHNRVKLQRAIVAMSLVASVALVGCATAPAGDEEVELTYAFWDQTQAAAMEETIANFEAANPGITVKTQVTPRTGDAYNTKLRTGVSSGTAPDVFWLGKLDYPTYVDGGAVLPIDAFVEESGFDLSVFSEGSIEGASWKGELMGMPKDTDAYLLWYNRTLFEEAGVAEPTADWVQQDLIDASIALTDADAEQYGFIAWPPANQYWFNTVIQEGGTVISADGKSSGLDSPEARRGIQFWVDMLNEYKVSPSIQQMTDTNPEDMFQSGKVAMIYAGTWNVSLWKDTPYVQENVAVAPMPKIKAEGGVGGGVTNVISASTDHPDAAWKFLEYLGSEEAAIIQAEGGIVPAYTSAQHVWADAAPDSMNVDSVLPALTDASPYPTSVGVREWGDFGKAELLKVYEGKLDLETALKNFAAEMDRVLAANN